jgi:glycosyltransferase involved in cell wall biosynthesis
MKILHAILSSGFYGSERYCVELAVAQARAGHAVVVMIQGRDTDCAVAFQQTIVTAGVAKAIGLVSIPGWAPAWLHRPLAWLMIKRFAPDVVHSHLGPAARRVGAVARRFGIPHVATLHLDYDEREHGALDGLVAVSSNQRGRISPQFSGEIATVWNWLSATIADALARVDAATVEQLRRAWWGDRDMIVFGSVGRLEAAKGMDVLIAAFRAAFPNGTEPTRLVILGDGSRRAELEKAAAGEPRIVLAGPQPHVAAYYRSFDVFVSAARFEPFGLAILEAMAAGCPLILTCTQGPSEFVTDPRVSWAWPGDAASLADALRAAASRRDGRLVYEMAEFTSARAAREIEVLYRRVIEKSGSAIGPLSGTP